MLVIVLRVVCFCVMIVGLIELIVRLWVYVGDLFDC